MGANKAMITPFSSGHVKDKRGQRFGKVVVESFDHSSGTMTYWKCKCDCGNEVVLSSHQLTHNHMPSCGCAPRYSHRPKHNMVKTHHMANTKIYRTWKAMKQRCACKNEERREYWDYYARGIKVCDEWQNSFEAFYEWAMANGYADNLSIDRIDNNGNYEPSNCRWVDNTTQQRNRRKTVFLTYEGETKALSEWCEIYGLKMKTCYGRLHQCGWTNPSDILFGRGGTAECPRIY